ncbi:unnamed protein product [Cylindrotheca closterium]|uniref:Uncharacterized protein n=1 Tax=Cylindrotheca closterium TaxID=2856 RepID=A0AAD2FS59_9STRA|nr:unnamed protein product [Cylindrotheca closterium]
MQTRKWIMLSFLATCFLVVNGKSLRRSSRDKRQYSSNHIIDKKERDLQRALQRIGSPKRRLQESDLQLETNTTAPREEEVGEGEQVFQANTNTTETVKGQEESALLLGMSTKAGEANSSSPFSFGTGNANEEQSSPFSFGIPQTENEEQQTETENAPLVNLDTELTTEEPSLSVNSTEFLNEQGGMPASANLDSQQSGQDEYMNFHFGAGQIHKEEHTSLPLNEEDPSGTYVDGNLVDQFANMFNMVHGNALPIDDPYPQSQSGEGKGSIYYDELGKGGKGKGGKGQASKGKGGVGKGGVGKGGVGKGGGMVSQDSGNTGSFDGTKGGPSGKYKVSKKASSSGSKAYRREHRLTMPPTETNPTHGGGSSEKSRRRN